MIFRYNAPSVKCFEPSSILQCARAPVRPILLLLRNSDQHAAFFLSGLDFLFDRVFGVLIKVLDRPSDPSVHAAG